MIMLSSSQTLASFRLLLRLALCSKSFRTSGFKEAGSGFPSPATCSTSNSVLRSSRLRSSWAWSEKSCLILFRLPSFLSELWISLHSRDSAQSSVSWRFFTVLNSCWLITSTLNVTYFSIWSSRLLFPGFSENSIQFSMEALFPRILLLLNSNKALLDLSFSSSKDYSDFRSFSVLSSSY